MANFGWSYPPGCSGTPYDEAQASDITKYVERLPIGVKSVYWDEDGNLQEGIPGTVTYWDGEKNFDCVEEGYRTVGTIEWDDDMSDEQNFVRAASRYAEIIGESSVKRCKEAFPDADGPGELYRQTYKYTACGPSVGFKVRMVEEAKDLEAGPGQEPFERITVKWFYCDDLNDRTVLYFHKGISDEVDEWALGPGKTWGPQQKTVKGLGTWDEMIDAGMEIIAISVSSIVEGVDYDTETIEIEIDGKTPDQIHKEFYEAVEEVNRQANDIWNDTHGCETCRKHWIEEGLPDGETEFGCPVWKECPDCEGGGIPI